MTTACVVQARMGSTRLPGKVMNMLAGETVLSHVLRRCRAINGVDVVVCATVEGADCDELAAEAVRCGAVVFRGSQDDVLDRYVQSARLVGADTVLRVTSDCPLIDPGICADLLALRAAEGADYASINMPPSWPHGLDCEAFPMVALERAWREATEQQDREHVSPWLRRHPDMRRANLSGPLESSKAHRWTLDYPEDFDFFTALFAHLPARPAIPGWREVIAVLDQHPEIVALNAKYAIHS
ncbi:MAG: glycosyltransferase family protein [Magnetospirillum sp.]|nr:glycosyltransferase family protein [Magnetospirillum sp.]